MSLQVILLFPQLLKASTVIMMIKVRLLLILAAIVCLGSAHGDSSVETYKYFVFTQQCYQQLMIKFNYLDTHCIKHTFSKIMGYALVIGGAIVKLPQIIKILVDGSVFGLSYQSILLQSLTNWVTIIYSWNYAIPFSIYGENAFILCQNILIIFLFIIFGHKLPQSSQKTGLQIASFYGGMFILFVSMMYFSQNPKIWPEYIIGNTMYFQMFLCTIYISIVASARIAQIYHIWRCKSTGSLALITCSLVFLGNLGRLFTILVEVNDLLFAISVGLATVLNGTILAQFFIYWNSKPMQNKQKKI